ncbi:hypothetical protein TNCV_2794741 [Trichonephila clavipes]|nr:hypothetical protein TNCV_2794741 [Trichonephila clavipes]
MSSSSVVYSTAAGFLGHVLESDGCGCEQFIHFGSRMQSVEALAGVLLEQVSCSRQEVCECPNLWHLKQCRGFGMYGRILQLSPTREAVCRPSGKNEARRLPGVHPEYNATASKRGSNRVNPPSLICSTAQQCLFGDTEERYNQPIDRSELIPASHLQRSVGQRERKGIPRTSFSSLRDTTPGKHAGWKLTLLVGVIAY